jgi:hypothetical protein
MPNMIVAPDQPEIQFVARQCRAVTVQCNPLGFNGGAPIIAYQINYIESNFVGAQSRSYTISMNNNNFDSPNTQNWALRQATINDAIAGRTYTFTCQAINMVGASIQSLNELIEIGDRPG